MLKNYFVAWQLLISVIGMLFFILVNYSAKTYQGINYQATGVHWAKLGSSNPWQWEEPSHLHPQPSAVHAGGTSGPHRAKASATPVPETCLLDLPKTDCRNSGQRPHSTHEAERFVG